jgi:hypothetical protein
VDEAGTGAVTVSTESTSIDKSPSSVDVDSGLSVGSDGQLSLGTNDDTDQAASTSSPISAFHLYRVRYVTRGRAGTKDAHCFAFTYTQAKSVHSIQAFRCRVPEAVRSLSEIST